jgi:hypothetical protein
MNWRLTLLIALSLAIGWGIRGNFGHEAGAMIPGALSAIAAVIASSREDWRRRVAYFAFFGALGWSFGGSMSYGQVLGYTHSGHSLSVLYGFASLFAIGFLWAALGGAATALPAVLDRARLTEFFAPLTAVFIAWWLQDLIEARLVAIDPQYRQGSPLYWYDTDWLGVTVALVTIIALALVRRRLDEATKLILHLGAGWWAGFAVLVLALGWRMTPPRSDNWAGCAGMAAAMIFYFERRGLRALTRAALVCGIIGGCGFALANLIKLVGIATGWQTNWHSVMEQVYGFINGLGIAFVISRLRRSAPRASDDPKIRRWTEVYAIAFVLLAMTWINFRKSPESWVRAEAVPAVLAGLPALFWFDLAYLMLSVAVVSMLIRHLQRPLPLIPAGWFGKCQLFYLVLLWWVVVGNFERALVAFSAPRLITEGVIFFNAVLCTVLCVSGREATEPVAASETVRAERLGKMLLAGASLIALTIAGCWGATRAIYGDQVAGGNSRQIRFGNESTATREKPAADRPHP